MKAYKVIMTIMLLLLASCSDKGVMGTAEVMTTIEDRELDHYVITKNTVLSGDIIINGSLIVKKNANLTILPGTVIRFRRLYEDDDDISDSDINVEGSIRAIGTREQPITFTSYEKDKKAKDWKFIMVNFARFSVFSNCIVEYAYSGVQLHFSKAIVENSIFRYNVDGVRFSTARVTVTRNDIHDNVNGIRYEERKAKAIVSKNEIHDNKIGIFAVLKSDNLSTFEQNNIFNNSDYNVKLGLRQNNDITMTDNFFGATDKDSIQKTIFDKESDDTLGKVHFAPFLMEKVRTGF